MRMKCADAPLSYAHNCAQMRTIRPISGCEKVDAHICALAHNLAMFCSDVRKYYSLRCMGLLSLGLQSLREYSWLHVYVVQLFVKLGESTWVIKCQSTVHDTCLIPIRNVYSNPLCSDLWLLTGSEAGDVPFWGQSRDNGRSSARPARLPSIC